MHLAPWALLVLAVLSTWAAQAHAQDCACPPEYPDCCTFTQGRWKNFHADRPENSPQHIPWPEQCFDDTTTSEHAELWPGQTMLDVFGLPVGGCACINLAHQWMAATLNRCNNACADSIVASALAEGGAILRNATLCPDNLGPQTVYPDARSRALDLAAILDQYNNGLRGPGHCDDEPPECPEFRCDGGCTNTQGFYKQHNAHQTKGGAKKKAPWGDTCTDISPDEGGTLLEDKLFFGGPLTWLEVLQSPVNVGEGCLIAGKQLIAAWLNGCNGACVPDELVAPALAHLPGILEAWCQSPGLPPPGQLPEPKNQSQIDARADALLYASILDTYNNGIILGPGHCDDAGANSQKQGGAGVDSEVEEANGNGDTLAADVSATLVIAIITLILVFLMCCALFFMGSGRRGGFFGAGRRLR